MHFLMKFEYMHRGRKRHKFEYVDEEGPVMMQGAMAILSQAILFNTLLYSFAKFQQFWVRIMKFPYYYSSAVSTDVNKFR